MLGANDGIVSVAAIIVGVAAAGSARPAIIRRQVFVGLRRRLHGRPANTCRSARRPTPNAPTWCSTGGSYANNPAGERADFAEIYRNRGLSPELAADVAAELSAGDDVLAVHARDELGMTELSHPRPFQASGASAAAFTAGASLPLIAVIMAPTVWRIPLTAVATLAALALTGWSGARLGGAPPGRGTLRVLVWGVAAMALTMLVGRVIGTNI